MILCLVPLASAALFDDVTASTLGPTAEWSNKVRMADLDADGDLDVLFANGGDYANAGTPEVNRIYRNDGTGVFTEVTLPGGPDLSRSLAVGDVNADGLPDILVSGVFQTASRLFLATASGDFVLSATLPTTPYSIGDVELGDVDDDGDLDAVLIDWGTGNPLNNTGGFALLWRNDGAGVFTADDAAMPVRRVGMSWDLSLADVDGDFDLDLLIASKTQASSKLFLNDGTGTFTNASAQVSNATNNYAVETMDADADGDIDFFTINDGPGLDERLLLNDGNGTFEPTTTFFPPAANVGEDDNIAIFLDHDDDGDADVIIGSLSGDDRLLVNDNGYTLSSVTVFGGGFTSGTLGLALGDLNADGKLDAAMAQGEAADDERLYFGADIAVDTTAPVVAQLGLPTQVPGPIFVRAHDHHSPVRTSDLLVELVLSTEDSEERRPFFHLGGDVFKAELSDVDSATVCLTDRAGNTHCETVYEATITPLPTDPPTEPVTPPPTDVLTPTGTVDPSGCGCSQGTPGGAWWLLGLVYQRSRRANSSRVNEVRR